MTQFGENPAEVDSSLVSVNANAKNIDAKNPPITNKDTILNAEQAEAQVKVKIYPWHLSSGAHHS